MNAISRVAVVLVVLCCASGLALADSISIVGDKDGLGIGVLDGQSFFFGDVGPADGDGTDQWRYDSQSWLHTYNPTGITGASLEIFAGGLGWYGQASLLIDGQFVGFITDGDGFDGGDEENRGRRDVFDLSPYLGLLTGSNTFTVQTVTQGDGWALDYSELSLQTRPVPEPGTLVLLGSGVLGLVAARRRRA